jgi:two-component system cell cycle response regulator
MPGRILVVDDVLANVKLLEARLSSEYFEVVTAMNGPAALDMVQRQSPDLVLLDVMMPGMDGFEVCRRIKGDAQSSHIPVVMVTALSDIADRVRGLEAGADDFVTKPVSEIALYARVRSLVRLKMTMDEWRLREQTSSQLGRAPAAPMLDVPSGEARILVIDNSAIDSANMRETLARDRNAILMTNTAEAGLKAAQEQVFDLIILSLSLTDFDPLRLCVQLRGQDRTRHVPILLIADEDDTGRLVKSLDLGASDYLIRPVDRNELLARARTQIRRMRYQDRLKASMEQSLTMALVDDLTGVHNYRYLVQHLQALVQRAKGEGKPFSLLFIDVDLFKQVNDAHGHAVGDIVLRAIARRLSGNLRNFDLVARYGGEEFVVLMPDTSLDLAQAVAERLRARVAEQPFEIPEKGLDLPVTISIGVAALSPNDESGEALLARGDQAMYAAKRAGRNQAVTLDAGASPGAMNLTGGTAGIDRPAVADRPLT